MPDFSGIFCICFSEFSFIASMNLQECCMSGTLYNVFCKMIFCKTLFYGVHTKIFTTFAEHSMS